MAIEISVISVGAVLLVVLLLLLICISGQRDKSIQRDHKGSKSAGNYLFVVCRFIFDHVGCTINYLDFMKIHVLINMTHMGNYHNT